MFLIFCKDGHMRLNYNSEPLDNLPLLNMKAMHDNLGSSALQFWTNHWSYPIKFEKGLTLRNFFSNLEPWIDFFQDLIPHAINLSSFLKEINKPAFLKSSEIEKNKEPLGDFLVINQFTTLSPCVFRKNHSRNPYLPVNDTDGKWNTNYSIKITGCFRDLREESFNIENVPLNLLANKSIYINNNHYFIFDNFIDSVSISKNIPNSVFNKDSYGVFQLNDSQQIMISEKEINIFEIFQHIFKFFFISPLERDMTLDKINNFLNNEDDEFKGNDSINEEENEDEHDNKNDIALSIREINSNNNIEEKNSNIQIQKNAFSFIDAYAQQIKSSIDEKFNF